MGEASLCGTSARKPCSIARRLQARGYLRGRAVTPSLVVRALERLVLAPQASFRDTFEDPPTTLAANVGFMGNERDDPHAPSVLCYGHETKPDHWRVMVGPHVRILVRNRGFKREAAFGSCPGDLHGDGRGLHLLGA